MTAAPDGIAGPDHPRYRPWTVGTEGQGRSPSPWRCAPRWSSRPPRGPRPARRSTVDANADRHPIDPRIYGLNFADRALARRIDLPVDRWGGNTTDAYNWQLGSANTGSDYYYENVADCWNEAHAWCAERAGPRLRRVRQQGPRGRGRQPDDPADDGPRRQGREARASVHLRLPGDGVRAPRTRSTPSTPTAATGCRAARRWPAIRLATASPSAPTSAPTGSATWSPLRRRGGRRREPLRARQRAGAVEQHPPRHAPAADDLRRALAQVARLRRGGQGRRPGGGGRRVLGVGVAELLLQRRRPRRAGLLGELSRPGRARRHAAGRVAAAPDARLRARATAPGCSTTSTSTTTARAARPPTSPARCGTRPTRTRAGSASRSG